MLSDDPAQPRPASEGGRPFIPHGVDGNSWLSFERRIQQRRFQALIRGADTALSAGDADAARVALAEAREICPDAMELAPLEARVAVAAVKPAARGPWRRASGAVALLAVGAGLLLAVDAGRRAPAAAPEAVPDVMTAQSQPAVSALGDLMATPAVRATAGPDDEPAAIVVDEAVDGRPEGVVLIGDSVPAVEPPPAPGEIADDYVAPVRVFGRREETVFASAPVAAAPVFVAPASAPAERPPAEATPAPAAVTVPRVTDESRVNAVLGRYARAYAQLDASAAHAVWPSVDERALARAFAGLASQSLEFETCAINLHGAVADALCRGKASYVTKVGGDDLRTEPRTWRFELRRDGEEWTIASASVSR